MLGVELDSAVKEYIKALRMVGGVINNNIVMAAAEGIVTPRDKSLLVKYGGQIEITKGWGRSLLNCMGYVKRKVSNAGKFLVSQFQEIQANFLADIQAVMVMNDIPMEMVFNNDQTALHFVSTGQWTMHKAGEKMIPISNRDDKCQITVVLGATLTGVFLPPQLIYQDKTNRCHPKVHLPESWDIWHSSNHWSNEETMVRYVEKRIVPFLDERRAELKLTL